MGKRDRGDVKPGSGFSERPDYFDGERALYFRKKWQDPPEDYDVAVPNTKDKDGIVYIKWLVMILVLFCPLAYFVLSMFTGG